MMAQYCQVLEQVPWLVSDLLIKLVELLKNFNSRTCQLILGAGALQLVGLKTISVRNLGEHFFELIYIYISCNKTKNIIIISQSKWKIRKITLMAACISINRHVNIYERILSNHYYATIIAMH